MSHYILGDWGTSSARFYLYEDDNIIDSTTGPGIKFTDNPEQAYLDLVRPWINNHGPLDSVLCGMVGANIGWREAGYCPCPANLSDLIDQLTMFSAPCGNIAIVPGVKTKKSPTGMPDVMRGEETQILGFAKVQKEEGLLCLPGTHTKWVYLKDGGIQNFMSSVNGELFNILQKHSILIGAASQVEAIIGDAFRHGVDKGASGTSLNQLLFSVRAQQIVGQFDQAQATSFLLGLLIGSDVNSAFALTSEKHVNIIAGAAPASFYADAIGHLGGTVAIHDGQAASQDGLKTIYNATTF